MILYHSAKYTKNASIIYGVWYLIALLLMVFQNGSMGLIVLATIFVGFGIGGIGNLIPSIIGTCFGRFGFIQANRLIAPVNTAIRSTALVIIGIIGALVPLVLGLPIYTKVTSAIFDYLPMIKFIQFRLTGDVFGFLFPFGIVFGVALGVIGSVSSIRKHLRV